MKLQLPIEEYFKYHPPTTPERIALHERVNQESLTICQGFISSENAVEIFANRDAAILLIENVCCDRICADWAKKAIENAARAASIDPTNRNEDRSTSILMHVQQFRMFLNQGITVDELKRQLIAAGMAAVTTEDIAEIFRMHGENVSADAVTVSQQSTIPVISKNDDSDKFNISPQKFVARILGIQKEINRRFDNKIELKLDGDEWCAAIGCDLQGIAGFGNDPIAALSDLYVTLKGIEFAELKNSSGNIYSTSIKSIEVDPEREDIYRFFIDAWGNAIANLDANGLSDRDTLIAELVATEEFEEIGGE